MKEEQVKKEEEKENKKRKIVIAGSRSFNNYLLLETLMLNYLSFTRNKYPLWGYPVEIISGGAKGADKLGERFANYNGLSKEILPANWGDIAAPGAVVRKNRQGSLYNLLAGKWRNSKMAYCCDEAVLFWDGTSGGTKDMMEKLRHFEKYYVIFVMRESLGMYGPVYDQKIDYIIENHGYHPVFAERFNEDIVKDEPEYPEYEEDDQE